jgi:hypothetical protein
VLQDWVAFINGAAQADYGTHLGFPYNFGTLRGYLTAKYDGTRTGVDGRDNEFEIAMRLVAQFM